MEYSTLQSIGIYGLIGSVNLAIIDYLLFKLSTIKVGSKLLNNKERVVILILWPIFGFTFWYNFWKSWFNR